MEEFLEFLSDVVPGVDFENCTDLIDSNVLSSFDILSIVSELEDEYDVELSPRDLVPENFNSAEALWKLVEERME